ncbi:hypothetical protein ENTCAN_08001 [Enterobacter cancerogenus ATCC 35316]|nr:hypothetical protein ENTCAN_08001 [Enterobacter cancerogenus ATCC 35316]
MREQALRPAPGGLGENREAACKNQWAFVCASTHNLNLCNGDHINRGWGVGLRRMERGCQIRRLSHVEPLQTYPEHITKKDGRYEDQDWRTRFRIVRPGSNDDFRTGSRQN